MSHLLSKMLDGVPECPNSARLSRHMARSSSVVRRYAETITQMAQAGVGESIINKHDRHCGVIMERISRTAASLPSQERIVTGLLTQLHEETAEHDMSFVMGDVKHKTFVNAFKKEFGVDVHHFDEVGNGVYVYLTADDNEKVRLALNTSLAIYETIFDKLGYILLRRGKREDCDFGSFGEALATWIFVHYSRPEGLEDMEGVRYDSRKLAKIERALKEAYRNELREFELREFEFTYGGTLYFVDATVRYHVIPDGNGVEKFYSPKVFETCIDSITSEDDQTIDPDDDANSIVQCAKECVLEHFAAEVNV